MKNVLWVLDWKFSVLLWCFGIVEDIIENILVLRSHWFPFIEKNQRAAYRYLTHMFNNFLILTGSNQANPEWFYDIILTFSRGVEKSLLKWERFWWDF